jgi:hypothetical protein
MRVAALVLSAMPLALLALWEVVIGNPVVWWLYVLAALVCVAGLIRFVPIKRQRHRLGTIAVVTIFIAALYFMDWTTRKPFLRDLDRIHIGMTEGEVRQIMGNYTEGTGLQEPPGEPASTQLTILGSGLKYPTNSTPTGEVRLVDSIVFRHSSDPYFNADWGIVSFENGKVSAVEFSPD